MKNRLLLLNVMLVALIAASAWRLRQNWLEARSREQAMFGHAFRPAPAPILPPFLTVPAVAAASYLDVAQQVLFSKDRNPVVVVEPAKEKPMPPLPFFHGVMDLGKGPTVILSEKSGGIHRNCQPGDKIGEFTIASIDGDGIEFDWDGKSVRRRFDELIDRNPQPPPPPPPSTVQTTVGGNAASSRTTDLSKSSVLAGSTEKGPGAGQPGEIRPCQPGDSSTPGTVTDGYKKVVSRTPFGPVCRWEPVN